MKRTNLDDLSGPIADGSGRRLAGLRPGGPHLARGTTPSRLAPPLRTAVRTVVLAVAGAVVGLGACNGKGGQPAGSNGSGPAAQPTGVTEADRAEAKRTFETICFACHGMTGKGDGPGSAALDPKPRDLSDPAWQKTVTDDHIRKVITMGGAAVGKSPIMPAQPQLKGTPRVLEALVAHVRNLAK